MNKPFQSFEETGDKQLCAPRLAALRAELKERSLDGFLIPRADEHQGEYVPPSAERLSWLTAFTGSAGLAVVLADKAALFVDSRYTLQAKNQTDLSLFEPLDIENTAYLRWIENHLPEGGTLGYDPWLLTQNSVERFRTAVERAGGRLTPCDSNPLDTVWTDRPTPPQAPAIIHPLHLAGETSKAKRTRIAEELKKAKQDAAVLTLPDSICWLLNMRGHDVPHTPFVLAFGILYADASVDLFMDPRKALPELAAHFGKGVRLRAPEEFLSALDSMKDKNVRADPATAAALIFGRLNAAGARIARLSDPCLLPKACKNAAELEGARQAHLRDGAALTRFLVWLAREAPKGNITEIEAAEKLETFRHETGALKDLSFDSISGAGPNGAVVHYHVTRKTDRAIKPGELYLIDSGGQYEDGTTDVTRAIAVGQPSEEMRDRFTRVLRGHIALARTRFPEGTTGAQLDTLARLPLWEAGLDYGHGTGHGVGAYLSVHEGPQSISPRGSAQSLKPGMICSNEPGYYKEGSYGIRIENLVVVIEAPPVPGAEKKLLGFETLTMAPIDRHLISIELLDSGEREWLNTYHAEVRAKIGPQIANDAEASAWLKDATAPM